MAQDFNNSIVYVRRLYDDVVGWYRSADTKAQVVLAIDGAFVAFLTSGIFRKPEDLKAMVVDFSLPTRILLLLMMLSLLLSIAAAIHCLWSRIYSMADLQEIIDGTARDGAAAKLYEPKIMWFFQMVAALDKSTFRRTLEEMDGRRELEAMASQIHILSGNVQRKHRAANFGFLFAAATLVLFLAAGVSYVVKQAF